ncbi:putative B3 domain-containing protein At5g35780 [Solanum pennellii]|uniref:B3 domain-containing protein At5g35780 n=1 Tax=Solanum pennellii TaxID=28526 RepID=A0ABM1G1N0_SOLPN|nr:putative B3 domain-containing protein At5g35780 [Solanum pennellii]
MLFEGQDNLRKAQRRMKKYLDKHHRSIEFNVGDKVLLKFTTQIWKQIANADDPDRNRSKRAPPSVPTYCCLLNHNLSLLKIFLLFSMGILMEDDVDGGSKEDSCITDFDCVDVEKDEAFRKNPFICEHSVDHYYYLLPRAKRSRIFRRKNPPPSPTVMSQKKGLNIRISFERKTIEAVDEDLSMEKNKTQTLFGEKQSKLEDREKKTQTVLDEKQSKAKDRKRKRRKIKPIIDPPVLPDELKEMISGMGVQISQVKLVIQKVLYDTDLNYKQMRLSIPINQVENTDFLTPQQKMVLETRDIVSNKKSKIQFNLIEPSLEKTKIHLAKWDMSNSSNYVLLNGWMQVVERNILKSGMVVQLWSFNQDLVPWLALVLVR